jgi:lysophospholipase L1-like esterase
VAILLSMGAVTGVLLAADVYAHRTADQSAGLNRWGYRGPVVAGKRPGETRLVVLGGSTAFGYGVRWEDAFPAQLERLLQARRDTAGDTSVVNLAYNNEGAYSFRFTLEDYRLLRYDIAIFYEGYNDIMGESNRPNTSVHRHESPIFRLTGYYPVLPLVLREKAMAIRYGGDIDAAYRAARSDKPVFRPPSSIVRRTAGAALDLAAEVGERVGEKVARQAPRSTSVAGDEPYDGCRWPWRHYCRSIAVATDYVLMQGGSVIVVGQPHSDVQSDGSERHREQQQALRTMLQQRFGTNARVRYVDLGDAVNLRNVALAYDGMHLTAPGNRVIAQDLVEPVLATIAQRRP